MSGASTRASVLLAGEQQIRVDVRGVGTPSASVVLTWETGSLTVTFTGADQIAALVDAFEGARPKLGMVAERVSVPSIHAPFGGVPLPTVFVTYTKLPVWVAVSGESDVSGTVRSWAHRLRWVDLYAGVVVFRLCDRVAYVSVLNTLRRAAEVAAVALPPTR